MSRQTVLLNNEALARLITEREVKQWLLARRLGIDRKTVSRWISGRTQRISKDNLTRLCDILEIGESTIVVGDRLEALGTREDRWEAARKLHEQDLIEIVGPSGNWELAESLVKSTIDPDMPAGLLSKLYLLLARVYHYMRSAEDFRRCAEISMRYAEQVSDEYMYMQARLCLATSLLMVANLRESAEHYEGCLETPELFTAKALAASLSNLSSVFHQLGEYDKALDHCNLALQAWSKLRPSMSHTTALYLRAQIAIELSMEREAGEAIEQCMQMAQKIRYQRIANLAVMLQADLLSLQENHVQAVSTVEEGLVLLAETPRVSQISMEFAARALRRAGRLEEAARILENMDENEEQFGFEVASGNMERARLALALDDQSSARQLAGEASRQFADMGASGRCVSGLPLEHYRRLGDS